MINNQGRQGITDAITDWIESEGWVAVPYITGPSFDPAITDPSVYTQAADWDEGASQPIGFSPAGGDTDAMVAAGVELTWTASSSGTYPVVVEGLLITNAAVDQLYAVIPFVAPITIPSIGSQLFTTTDYTEGQLA